MAKIIKSQFWNSYDIAQGVELLYLSPPDYDVEAPFLERNSSAVYLEHTTTFCISILGIKYA